MGYCLPKSRLLNDGLFVVFIKNGRIDTTDTPVILTLNLVLFVQKNYFSVFSGNTTPH
jgi:hypothetical protein